MKGLAEHFAVSDPAKALQCAGEAIVRARTLDQPERTLKLAELGTLVARLGNKEAGEKLVREAAEKLRAAGAHYLIASIGELPPVLDEIEIGLALGERP